jgi:hypothetical protein
MFDVDRLLICSSQAASLLPKLTYKNTSEKNATNILSLLINIRVRYKPLCITQMKNIKISFGTGKILFFSNPKIEN